MGCETWQSVACLKTGWTIKAEKINSPGFGLFKVFCFCKSDLRLPDVDWVSELQHRLRDGWRWLMFVKFLDQDRHDNQDFEYTIQDFWHFYFQKYERVVGCQPFFSYGVARCCVQPCVFSGQRSF